MVKCFGAGPSGRAALEGQEEEIEGLLEVHVSKASIAKIVGRDRLS